MLTRFSDWLGHRLLKGGKRNWLIILSVFFVIIFPLILIAAFSYIRTHRDLTDFALSRRQAIASLAAATIKEKLDRLIDIGVSLATRVRFAELVGLGRWEEAIEILRAVPKDFSFIDRVFLADPGATLMADTPELAGERGRNFAYRDWYQGASHKWEPYTSGVYQRAAEPRFNVVAVAVPIKAKDRDITGILVLQVRIDSLLAWMKEIEVGPSGFLFAVDREGKVVAHPQQAVQGKTTDYSTFPSVQKVLGGKQGVEVLFNPMEKEDRVVAYAPVPGYGWGVIAQEPTATAFAARNSSLRRLLFTYGFIALLAMVLAYLIVRTFVERKTVEELLTASEERFRGMAEAASDAIISADSSGNITYFNRGAERMFGYIAGEAVGQPLTLLMPETFRDAHRQGLKRFLSTGEARVIGKTVELVGKRRDGAEFPLELSLSTLRTSEGVFFTGILRDATERKRFEAEILDRNKQIEAANKELEAFSYSVSHDLRAPLRAMDGFSRILLEKQTSQLPPENQRYLGLIRDNAQQMGRLIDDLLAFSRLSRQALRKQTVAPAEMVRQALNDLRHEETNGQVQISVGDLVACQADPALLRQIFVNLLSNAIKFASGREGARVEIGCFTDNGEPVYFVKDNGAGFDMKYADKLFGVFQRLHRAEEYEGTGVGLAIVHRIVSRHGGRVWAEAEMDKGATFYFTLGGDSGS